MKPRSLLSGLAVTALAFGGVLVTATPAAAASILVDTDDDGNSGMTLRAAVDLANLTLGPDVITFSPSLANNTIELDPAKSYLSVTEGLTIQGLGSGQLTLAGASALVSQLIRVEMDSADQDFTLTGITMQGTAGVSGLRVGTPTSVDTDDVTVADVWFNQFNSSGAGMAMAVIGITGNLTIGAEGVDTTFTSNVGASAGALAVNGVDGDVTITDTVFANNLGVVVTPGGAVSISSAGDVTITGSEFDGNVGADSGGGLAISNVDSVSIEADFTNNIAANQGGGLFLGSAVGPVSITNSRFDGNTSPIGAGLGVVEILSDSTIAGSSFTNNFSSSASTTAGGGGAYVVFVPAQLTVSDSLFQSNSSAANGGGLGIRGIGATGAVIVDRSTFADNAADLSGLSIWVDDVLGPIDITQSTFDETGGQSDAVFGFAHVEVTAVTIESSTIVGPLPFDMIAQDSSSLDITHTILETGPIDLAGAMTGGVEWSIFSTLESANEIVQDAPGNQFSTSASLGVLADNGGPTPTRLPQPGSPAIDRGAPGYPGPAATDQRGAGFSRVIHSTIDIGAVETAVALAATGSTVSLWVPIIGAALVLLGLGIVLVARRRGRA